MRRSRINKVSAKQVRELQKRKDLKAELMKTWNGICPDCGEPPDFRGISLSHKIPLSRGGETQIDNLTLLCYKCHSARHHIYEQ